MKAFKKWFNNSNRFDVRGCEAGWKAALEWVKEEILECLSPQEALEVIREELEAKDE